jgi:hypothetical protein
MTHYESPVRHIPYAQQKVYDKLSDLDNIKSLQGKIPEDKIKNLSFDSDHVSFDISGMGTVQLEVVERTPIKCIKFETTKSPIPLTVWIQLVPVTEEECKMKITAGLEVNLFMKGIISKPVQEGLEKISEILSMIQY